MTQKGFPKGKPFFIFVKKGIMRKITALLLAVFGMLTIQAQNQFKPFFRATAQTGMEAAPVYFEGQGKGIAVFARRGGISFVVSKYNAITQTFQAHRSDLDFKNTTALPEGIIPVKNITRYTSGTNNSAIFEGIIYRQLTPGVDLQITFLNGQPQLRYEVAMGASLDAIEFAVSGGTPAEEQYGFVIQTPLGAIENFFPLFIAADASGKKGSNRHAAVNAWMETADGHIRVRAAQPVAPEAFSIILWCTFAGGSDSDEFTGIEQFANSDLLITGYTASVNFPLGVGTVQDSNAGNYDAVIMRMDTTGNRVWATFFGGSAFDAAYHGAIYGDKIYVAGTTGSANLPVDTNGWQPAHAGSYDSWLLKLDSTGQQLWSTFFGSNGGESAYDVDVDNAGNIYMGGSTTSSNMPLAAATGWQPNWSGALDAWIAKFNSNGVPQWCTYYGGTGSEDVHSLVLDDSANVVMCGGTFSLNFPTSPGAYQDLTSGIPDIYVIKFDSAGNRLFGTRFGGSSDEDAFGLDVDASGNIYIAGQTHSTDLPMVGQSYQNIQAGNFDACVVKFNNAGWPVWSSFYGGQQDDLAYGLVVRDSFLYFTGNTQSADFEVSANAFQDSLAGQTDAYFVKMDTAGTPISGSFYGGTGSDVSNALTVDANMALYLAGSTYSQDFPVSPSGVMQSTNMFLGDGFVARLDASQVPSGSATPAAQAAQEHLQVFPVPFGEVLYFGERILSWQLLDVTGRIVLAGTSAAITTADQLAPGVYTVLAVNATGSVKTARIVKGN